jgi:predicted anti-sigma-YlaC factor YlaD
MKTDGCREWRESLGAHALGQLPGDERAGLEAHLEGCPACRAELESLESVARMMPLADPERFGTSPVPPPELADRVAASIRDERRSQRRRRRFGLAFGGAAAAAAAAAALAIFVLGGGSGPETEQRVAFGSLPAGMKITATLEPRAFGTEIHMYVTGVRSGTLCRVALRGPRGIRLPAGTFRYRYGTDEDAVLSSALDLSSTRSIVVNVGNRTFSAPVNSGAA